MIRKAEKRDLPALNELLKQVLSIHAQKRPDVFKVGTKKYTDEELLDILQNSNTPVFVAVDENDRVHGYAFCIIFDIKDHNILQDLKYLYIDDLCVDKTVRRSGIGTELYQHILKFAKEIDCTQVQLNVWNLNDDALHFYKKCGMSVLKTTLEKCI